MENEEKKTAEQLSEEIERSIIRGVVKTIVRGSVVLQNGDYITEEDIEKEREFMRNYKFRYPVSPGA